MTDLNGKVAWVTGAGTGIGEASALSLAKEGVAIALSGRRPEPLQVVADKIAKAGGKAIIAPGDMGDPETPNRIAQEVAAKLGRLDILVNNAGSNVVERNWSKLNPERIKYVLDANLNSAFYCAASALNVMRLQKDGLLIHTASWAGRFIGTLSGPAYVAAKHGVVAMSYEINMEEFMNGIRSTVLCPNEVATPILDRRPIPVPQADRDRMIQPQNMADLVVYVARQPASICINEIVIMPTWNRGYAAAAGLGARTG